ncbi:MAG: thiamine phosphate synthase [Thermoplasmata archaeon]
MTELPKGIYGITSRDFGKTHVESAEMLLKAGIEIIQYREKNASTRKMLQDAIVIKKICMDYGAIFIVNDRLDIAIASDADGVHLGQEDMPIEIAKRMFPGKIIGISVSNVNETIEAQEKGADYLGAGSIFPTGTKKDSEVIGIDMLRNIMNVARIPVYAIGGITLENLDIIKRCNVWGVAVISAILNAESPVETAKEFIKRWEK